MLRLDNETVTERFKLFIWFLMSFQAGYINVGGFIIFGSFVSHVTGTSSQIGMGISSLNYEQLITFLVLLLAFISGSAFAGHFLSRKMEEGKEPQYILVTAFKAFLFASVLIVSEYYFDNMSHNIKLTIILMLSLACGIQNATCAIATNGFLKPTHMTGLSTDIGINLTKVFGLNKESTQYKDEVKKNKLRVSILTSFIGGGAIAYFIFSDNGHYGFLFPFLSSVCMLITSIVAEKEDKLKYDFYNKVAQSSVFGVFLTTLIIGIFTIVNS